jgi:putative redox protein
VPGHFDAKQRTMLEKAGLSCPVHRSLHPEIEIPVRFVWGG